MAPAVSIGTAPERLDRVLGLARDVLDAPDFSDQPDPFSWSEEQVAEYDAAHAPETPATPALALVPKRSLRALVEGVEAIAGAVEALDDDEMTPALRDALSEQLIGALAGTRKKVDDTARVIAMFEALNAAAIAERDRLDRRAAYYARQVERIEIYVMAVLTASNLDKIDGETSALARRKNPASVEIVDTASIPREYFRHKPAPPPEPDKTSIIRDLKKQRDVPGARIAPVTYRLVRS